MTLRRETSIWAHTIFAAAISSAANSIAVLIVDPAKFNFTPDGIVSLFKVGLISAGVGIAAVLKQSPLPRQSEPSAPSPVVVVDPQQVVVEPRNPSNQ